MTLYFRRYYRLEIGSAAETLRLEGAAGNNGDPAQIRFTVTQTPNAHRSYAEITVYGLAKATRDKAYRRFDRVKLEAGYEERHGTIFVGQIENVEIGREGPDSFIKLFAQSAVEQWPRAYVHQSWGPNTPGKDIVEDVAEAYNLPVEFIGDFSALPRAVRGRTISRSARSALNELGRNYGFSWSIENERVVLARDGNSRQGGAFEYSALTGLVGTPQITQAGIDIEVLLDPRIRPFNEFEVRAETGELTFNGVYYQRFPRTLGTGQYRAISMTHEGDFYGDTWTTSIEGIRKDGSPLGS